MTNMPVIHLRHCEGRVFPAMDRHGLRPRDDGSGSVIASAARQSMLPTKGHYTSFAMPDQRMDRHGLRPRGDEGILVISTPQSM